MTFADDTAALADIEFPAETPEAITLRLVDDDSSEVTVTVELDFMDLRPVELRRVVSILADREPDEATTCVAFIFVKAARQVSLEDDDFDMFRSALAPLWEAVG